MSLLNQDDPLTLSLELCAGSLQFLCNKREFINLLVALSLNSEAPNEHHAAGTNALGPGISKSKDIPVTGHGNP
jgi:hypothetical protein